MLRNQSEKVLMLSRRPAKYSDMIKVEKSKSGTKNSWLKEKPYQLKYMEKLRGMENDRKRDLPGVPDGEE